MAVTRQRLILISTSLAVVAALAALFWPRRVVDYGSGAAGLVVDIKGNPVSGASVTVSFDRTVFDAITPLRKTQLVTDERGRFQEFFISCGKPGGPYTVTVDKPGFQPARLRGEGMGRHRIVLLRQDQLPIMRARTGAG